VYTFVYSLNTQCGKNAAPIPQDMPEERTYPLRNSFDDDDDDIDEGGEWTLGRRRPPLRSRSVGERTSTKQRRPQQRSRRKGEQDEDDVVDRPSGRGRRLLEKIIGMMESSFSKNSE